LTKYGSGHILSDFFSKASGHPEGESRKENNSAEKWANAGIVKREAKTERRVW
jgi:hypothetical protein